MKILDKYIKYAAECREMVRINLPSQRVQLIEMAETWDQLAEAYKRQMEKQGHSDEGE